MYLKTFRLAEVLSHMDILAAALDTILDVAQCLCPSILVKHPRWVPQETIRFSVSARNVPLPLRNGNHIGYSNFSLV